MGKDVFISHSKEDKSFADIVCAALERQGLDCWIAPRDVAPGVVFDEAIIDGIEACQVLVLVLSGSANASRFVQNEVNRAFSKGKAIVTFRAEDVLPAKSLELYLARHHWTDGFPPPLDEKATRLAAAVLALVGRTPCQPFVARTAVDPRPLVPTVPHVKESVAIANQPSIEAQSTTDAQPGASKSSGQAPKPALVVTDRSGEQTFLEEFGILYNPYGRGIGDAKRDGLIIERGSGMETIAWINIESVDVTSPEQSNVLTPVPLVGTVTLKNGRKVTELRLRSGAVVGPTALGGTFELRLAEAKRIELKH